MGLREKQLVRKYQEETLPSYNEAFSKITGGGEFEWEVDWDSFLPSEKALLYFENQGLGYLQYALNQICYNDFGKRAIREGLKKIVIKNFLDKSKAQVMFSGGVLTLYGNWAADTSEGYTQSEDIQRILEDGL